ncbi:MAG: ABC transporter ATP-binding protein [Chloroflexota bacterium]|nr:ABC transporter ATP-binding protein [Chloroflexota bacterium]
MTVSEITLVHREQGPLAGPRWPVQIRLIGRALRYWRAFVVAIFVVAAATALNVAAPWLTGLAIDAGLDIATVEGAGGIEETVARGTIGTLLFAVGLLVVVGLVRGISMYAQTYLGEHISQRVAYDFRNDLYDHLQRLSYAYHDSSQIGQIMSRATQDVEGVRMFVSMGVIRLLFVFALLGGVFALMISTNTKVGLIALGFVPLVAIQGTWTSARLRPIWLKVQDLQGDMSNVLQENLTGQRVVKAFSRTEFEQRKFDEKVDELFKWSYSTSKFQAFNEPFLQSLWLLSLAVVFWAGATEIQAGRMTVGDLAAFQLYLTLLQVPVRSIGWIIMMFARAHSTGARIFEILDAESAVQERDDARPLGEGRGDVRFEGVSFEYSGADRVLHNLDVHAEPGEMIALLGPTGSGKSTVVNLLPRFYDVTSGRITIDGDDVRDVTLESLRDAIGIVQQDLFLFIGTIRENISYGVLDATDEQIEAAAKAAKIHDFIMEMPEGYDTWVGERGTTLSGGQRQRISIARTLLRDPRVLILDDSTASVDMRTEYEIHEALQALMEGRTTFVIAQRLRTVKAADQILVLRDGEIVERGRHEELLAADGFYRQIYDLELRDQEEASASLLLAENGGRG